MQVRWSGIPISLNFPQFVAIHTVKVFSVVNEIESEKWKYQSLSRVWLFATPWTGACQTPLAMGFSRQEYWNGLLFRSPEDLPNPGIKPGSPTLQEDSLLPEPPGKPQWSRSRWLSGILLQLYGDLRDSYIFFFSDWFLNFFFGFFS